MIPYLLFCILCVLLFMVGSGWFIAWLWAIVTVAVIAFPILREVFRWFFRMLDKLADRIASDKET